MDLTKESYLSGAEFRPGNPKVVHHALIFLDSTGTSRKLAAASAGGGYPCFGGVGLPAQACLWAGLRDTLPGRPNPRCRKLRTGSGRRDADPLSSFGQAGGRSILARFEVLGAAEKGRALLLVVTATWIFPPGNRIMW